MLGARKQHHSATGTNRLHRRRNQRIRSHGNQRHIRTIYVGPEKPLNAEAFDEVILSTATEALPKLIP